MSDVDRTANLLERLARLLLNDGHAGGLKPVQWEALRFLARANRFSRTPSGLTAWLGLTKGTVSQTLMGLEQKGLLRKRGVREDRRSVRLDLTRAGERALEDDPLDAMREAVSRLPAASRSGLESGLEQLLHARIEMAGRRPFGQCLDCRYFRRDDPAGAPNRCALLDEPLHDHEATHLCVEQAT